MSPRDRKEREDEREARHILQEYRQSIFIDRQIDLMNQTLWVASGHTLKDGGLIPKTGYFKGGK